MGLYDNKASWEPPVGGESVYRGAGRWADGGSRLRAGLGVAPEGAHDLVSGRELVARANNHVTVSKFTAL